jgi:hypothetical protein
LGTDYVDREPFITYHPPTNKFFVVWEWDQENNQQTEIGAVIVSGVPLAADNSAPNLVGSTVEVQQPVPRGTQRANSRNVFMIRNVMETKCR